MDQTKRMSARIAAHESWANTENRTARTAPARAALAAKFLEQAGGDPIRAEHLRKAHFARLALKSADARRRKSTRKVDEDAQRLKDYIEREVADAPPLTPEQRDRLALLLRSADGGAPAPLPPVLSTIPERPVKVYRHLDKCGCLIYIGISSAWVNRQRQHSSDSWWSKWTARIDLDERDFNRDEALAFERELIRTELPTFNATHAVGDRDERIIRYLAEHDRWEHLRLRTGSATGQHARELIAQLVASEIFDPITWSKEATS